MKTFCTFILLIFFHSGKCIAQKIEKTDTSILKIQINDFSNKKQTDISYMLADYKSISESTIVILNQEKILKIDSKEFLELIGNDKNTIKIITDNSVSNCKIKTVILIATK
ncbi:MAG: hypothetical protein HYX40_12120 [Sphingobacteriales bacterium]|nr:hypothetical protein [Sphingobacteriales bacterium]